MHRMKGNVICQRDHEDREREEDTGLEEQAYRNTLRRSHKVM